MLYSWKAVHAYRSERDHLRDPSIQGSPSSGGNSRQSTPSQLEYSKQKEKLTAAFPFVEANLTPGTLYLAGVLNTLLVQQKSKASLPRARLTAELASLSDQVGQILVCEDLTAIESQICCGLVAFCLQLRCPRTDSGTSISSTSSAWVLDEPSIADFTTPPNVPPLSDVAQTFLNKKLSGLSDASNLRLLVAWSALVMGSYLLQHLDGYVRRKGHIVLVSLDMALRAASGDESRIEDNSYITNGWKVLESNLKDQMGMFWHEELAERWKDDWMTTIARQQRWAGTGLWIIGAPKTLYADGRQGGNEKVDVVEHLILKDARDTLPLVGRSPPGIGARYLEN